MHRGSFGGWCTRLTRSTVPARSWTPMAIRLRRGGCGDAEPRTGGCLVSAPPPSGRSPDHACGAAPGGTTANGSTLRCAWCATNGVKVSVVILIARIADDGPNGRALPGKPPAQKPSCVARPGWPTVDRCGPGRGARTPDGVRAPRPGVAGYSNRWVKELGSGTAVVGSPAARRHDDAGAGARQNGPARGPDATPPAGVSSRAVRQHHHIGSGALVGQRLQLV